MLPNPIVSPEHGSPLKLTFATTLLVDGSMRWTAFGFVDATHTASSVASTQSAVPPTFNVATGLKEANGTCTSFTPGFGIVASGPGVCASTPCPASSATNSSLNFIEGLARIESDCILTSANPPNSYGAPNPF